MSYRISGINSGVMCAVLLITGMVSAASWGPQVETGPASDIDEQSIQVGGVIIEDGGKACYYWFSYREAGTSLWSLTPVRWPAQVGDAIQEVLPVLKPGIVYQYRAHVRNYAGEGVGDTLEVIIEGQERSLLISSSEGGAVTQPGEGYYTYSVDASQALEAVPEHGYGFLNWTGTAVDKGRIADPNAAFTLVTVDSNDTLEANFSSMLTDKRWQWQILSTIGFPTGRHETSLVECGGRFYMIGGRESQKIDRFDPETKTWTRMGVTTPLIHHFQPVVWDKKIYMVGAMTGGYPTEPPMQRVQIYDPETDTWTEGDLIPVTRRRGSAGTVVYQNKIYMACGITLGHTSGTNNWFDEYDPATGIWTELPDAPHIRDHFHAVVLNDKLYCIGGRNTSVHTPNFSSFFGAVEQAVDVYDFKTGTWSTLEGGHLPVGSAAGGVAVLNGLIVYFGGENASTALNRTWAFDPLRVKWSALAEMQQGRHGSQAAVYDGRIYIAAGSPNRGGGRVSSIEMFSPVIDTGGTGRRR